jgi:hypothetical protein
LLTRGIFLWKLFSLSLTISLRGGFAGVALSVATMPHLLFFRITFAYAFVESATRGSISSRIATPAFLLAFLTALGRTVFSLTVPRHEWRSANHAEHFPKAAQTSLSPTHGALHLR